MVNPFDNSFFKFLLGFICILVISFTVIYLAGIYIGSGGSTQTAQTVGK